MDKKRILIVDDSPDTLTLTSLTLKKFGYDTLTARNGREAFEIIQKEKPDLVLLDLIIPIVYGNGLCKRIKSDEELKHIPIILFTAYSDVITIEKAKEFGADDYIVKPFTTEELLEKVDKALAGKVMS